MEVEVLKKVVSCVILPSIHSVSNQPEWQAIEILLFFSNSCLVLSWSWDHFLLRRLFGVLVVVVAVVVV